jgi:hypothetical protein
VRPSQDELVPAQPRSLVWRETRMAPTNPASTIVGLMASMTRQLLACVSPSPRDVRPAERNGSRPTSNPLAHCSPHRVGDAYLYAPQPQSHGLWKVVEGLGHLSRDRECIRPSGPGSTAAHTKWERHSAAAQEAANDGPPKNETRRMRKDAEAFVGGMTQGRPEV